MTEGSRREALVPELAHLARAIAEGRVRLGSPGDGERYAEEDG